jgi:hypothetical protein
MIPAPTAQWPIPSTRRTEDFAITFLFLEFKSGTLNTCDLFLDSGREVAIIQRLDEIGPKIEQWERLHAISAIGKRWRPLFRLLRCSLTEEIHWSACQVKVSLFVVSGYMCNNRLMCGQ